MKSLPTLITAAVIAVSLTTYPLQTCMAQDIGRPHINNYHYQEYGATGLNWQAIEDDRGIMYFANNAGALEFDGENWTVIDCGGGVGVRGFAKTPDGTVYVGLNFGGFGYLAPNEAGQMQYVSLVEKIPEEDRDIQEIWDADYFDGAVYFAARNRLFKWDGEVVKVIRSEDAIHVRAVIGDRMYVRLWNKGLCELKNDEFHLLPNGEMFADKRIYSYLPYDENTLLIGTRENGFYLYDGQDFTPFKTEIDEIVHTNLYLPGHKTDDGKFIFNSFAEGVFVLDKDGKLLKKIGEAEGLAVNNVNHIYEDSRGILWMSLFNGIASTKLKTNLTYMAEESGLPGNTVFVIIRHRGILYVGTNNGAYYFNDDRGQFQHVEGTHGQITAFAIRQGQLLAGGGGMGVIELIDKKFRSVRESINYDFRCNGLYPSRIDTNRIYAHVEQGLASLYYNKRKRTWEEESVTEKMTPPNFAFEEDQDGDLWSIGRNRGEIYRMKPKLENGILNLDESEITTYTTEDGLPEEYVNIARFGNQLEFYVGQTHQAYHFNPINSKFDQIISTVDDQIDTTATIFGYGPIHDDDGRIWGSTGREPFVLIPQGDGNYETISEPFMELSGMRFVNSFVEKGPDEETTVWFVGDGIARYQGDLEASTSTEIKTLLRGLSYGDKNAYGGAGDLTTSLAIEKEDNTVAFAYAAPSFTAQKGVQYQTYLQGIDEGWSQWTRKTEREYINLPAGKYVFQAKSKNIYGQESQPISTSFQILPAWYQTWWAYLLYALIAALLIYALVKARTTTLKKRQLVLEESVAARTAEVRQRLDELATVNRVSQALTEKLDFDGLVNLVGEQMRKLFKANISYLAILDPKTEIINFPYQHGDNMAPMKMGEGLTSQIIATGKPLLINQGIDKVYDERGLQRIGKNAASYLGVPIPVEDEVIGVLSVQSTEQENRFGEDDKRLLNTIARTVGIALHNAELFEDAKTAKAQAEDANEAKSAFLSTVSHELRTPLTSVLGFAKIIRKRLEDKIFPQVEIKDQKTKRAMKQVSENLGVVVSEGERLTKLINDVLDLAKIEAGKVDWNMQPIFMQDVISRAISATTALFEAKNLELVKNVPTDLSIVNGDVDKLIQVVINLLSNAVKFTEKGTVTVEAYEDDGQIIIEVQDTGIGIAEEDTHKVFEKFRQAGDTLTDKPQGTGLGLPICREIIEQHGGIIWMKSDFGVGSTFFFSIPLLGDGKGKQPLQLDQIVSSLKKQIAHTTEPTVGTQTILVVDDDTPIRSLLRQELSHAGYEVREAANGKAALDMVRTAKPDLILLDVMMPEINGFDVAAVLKNDPETMDIPIIILSIVEDEERGFRIGVDRYLTKPIDTERLFQEVGSLLEQGVSNKKVLVVDRDTSTVKTLTEVLNARGYNVVDANGDDPVALARSAQPDIIMLNSTYGNGNKELVKSLKFEKGLENVLFFVYQ